MTVCTTPECIPDRDVLLADYEVQSVDSGDYQVLPDLWTNRRVVVCFLRQFGCRFCKQQVAGLAQVRLPPSPPGRSCACTECMH